jgi:hypothetical protein
MPPVGEGYSSVAVAGGVAYTMDRQADHEPSVVGDRL